MATPVACGWAGATIEKATRAFGQEQRAQKAQNAKKVNSRKSVRWSAVPVAPKLVYVRCEGETGSGPEGADDLCCFYLSLKAGIRAWRLEFEPRGWALSHEAGI